LNDDEWNKYPLYDHLLNVLCNGDTMLAKYVLDWLSYAYQKKEKTGVAITFIGR
jgi:hypothetical protein